jgi:hypothetical protein
VAPGHRAKDIAGGSERGAGRSIRPSFNRVSAICLQQIRSGVPHRLGRATRREPACEIYHYNSDSTLDWGYFQINTVHLKRAGVNLRDLLDCKANIDFAYKLYTERGFEPWSTFNSGAYRQFLRKP